MYEISSCYDRDFLIHEIFISWRFHDPYVLCINTSHPASTAFESSASSFFVTLICW